MGLGDVEGDCSIGEDACGDEVGGAEVAERRRQEVEEDQQGIDKVSTEEEEEEETLTETERRRKKDASEKGKEKEEAEDADAEGSTPADGDVDMES